jgi:hypothetical protein
MHKYCNKLSKQNSNTHKREKLCQPAAQKSHEIRVT